jgi:hypothetical protein
MKTFYSHIVDWQQVVVRMEELEIDEHDRIGLSNLKIVVLLGVHIQSRFVILH